MFATEICSVELYQQMCNTISFPTCIDSTAADCLHYVVGDRRGPSSCSPPWGRWSGGRGQAWSPDTLLRLICFSAPTARVCLVVGAIRLISMLFIMMMMHQSNNVVIMMMITIPEVSDC